MFQEHIQSSSRERGQYNKTKIFLVVLFCSEALVSEKYMVTVKGSEIYSEISGCFDTEKKGTG